MRSQWHIRQTSPEHDQWYQNLVALNELTTHWLMELQATRPSYVMTRGLSLKGFGNILILDSLHEKKLEDFLDDTQPEDMLGRLEETIWEVQSRTLATLLEKASASSHQALISHLEQVSWKQGRACAESRWKNLPALGLKSLGETLLALHHSPLLGYPHRRGYLIKRAVDAEIEIELRSCPHQIRSQYPEIEPIADPLCLLHFQWIRGYAYALNTRTHIEYLAGTPRCKLRWSLMQVL